MCLKIQFWIAKGKLFSVVDSNLTDSKGWQVIFLQQFPGIHGKFQKIDEKAKLNVLRAFFFDLQVGREEDGILRGSEEVGAILETTVERDDLEWSDYAAIFSGEFISDGFRDAEMCW